MVTTFTPTPAPDESQIMLRAKEWFSSDRFKTLILYRRVIATVSSIILVIVIGLSMINPQQPTQQTISPELARLHQIQQASYQVSELSKNRAVENFTLNTAGMTPGSGVAEQKSNFQAALSNAVLDYRQRINKQITDENHEHYQKHEALAHQSASRLTAKIALAAAEGNGLVVTFRDPETKTNTTMEFSADEALLMAMLRDQISTLAQSGAVVKETNRMDMVKDLWTNLAEFQGAVRNLLDLQGYTQIAEELGNTDIFGRRLVAPQIGGETLIPSSPPITAPQIQEQSFAPQKQHRRANNQQISFVLQAHPGY